MKLIIAAVLVAMTSAVAANSQSDLFLLNSINDTTESIPNDPSILNTRSTRAATVLGVDDQIDDQGVRVSVPAVAPGDIPVDNYPAELGQATGDEGYPAKECDNCHEKL